MHRSMIRLKQSQSAAISLKEIAGFVLLAIIIGALSYFTSGPRETESSNQLAIGEFAKVKEEVKVPIYSPPKLNGLTRDQILKLRSDAVNQTAVLLSNEYKPSGEVFANMQDGLSWFRMDYFLVGATIPGTQMSAEGRFISNPFILVAPEFWGLTHWMSDSIQWNYRKIRDEKVKAGDFPAYCSPLSLSWWPTESRAEVTYPVREYMEAIKPFTLKGISQQWVYFGLTAYNARDLGFDYLAIDKSRSMNVIEGDPSSKDPSAQNMISEEPVLITDRIIPLPGICGPGNCNHSDIPMIETSRIEVGPLPAKLAIKLWQNKPENANTPPDMYFYINLL